MIAIASAKVGVCFSYQAAVRTGLTSALISRSAINVTIENNPKSAGVVRAIARSLHCLWVSIPKCARASSKLTSIRQRRTNQLRICSGVWFSLVDNNAWGSNSSNGSRINTNELGPAYFDNNTRLPSRYRLRLHAFVRRTSVRPQSSSTSFSDCREFAVEKGGALL